MKILQGKMEWTHVVKLNAQRSDDSLHVFSIKIIASQPVQAQDTHLFFPDHKVKRNLNVFNKNRNVW